ncbi:MAG: hypothetical protein ACT4TC_09635 [Myxococcaceae bacterium]
MQNRSLAVSALAFVVSGCLTLSPRFSQEVAQDFASRAMRKLETPNVTLYYPDGKQDKARRVAAALQRCSTSLRQRLIDGPEQPRLLAYLTDVNFNNAYVQPVTPGLEQQMVLSDAFSFEMFNWLNLGISQSEDVSCHEAVHAVHVADVHGFWKGLNLFTGGLLSPQIFSQSWFLEGLATHYEGQLIPTGGRPASPLWRAMFESGIASQGGALGTSYLSPNQRELLPYGAQYLVGQSFVSYLAKRHGEKKLWELVDRQGSSIFSPFGVTLRFDTVYDKTIGGLLEDFEVQLKRTVELRQRPSEQRSLEPNAGYVARLAASPTTGAVAIITARRDDVVRLIVREKDGTVRFQKALTQILPGRRWIVTSPSALSGLSFTADGQSIFFSVDDLTLVGAYQGRLIQLSARDGSFVASWEGITGLGGGVHPDGSRFLYVDQSSGTSNLAALHLGTREHTPLTHFADGKSLGSPVYSTDGKRIAFARHTQNGFNLFVREEDGALKTLTEDGKSNYGPRWIDGRTLIFTREAMGRLQAHRVDADSGKIERVTNAPYAVLDAAPIGGDAIAFLNRDAWSWTVDTAPLQSLAEVESARGEITAVRIARQPDATAAEDMPAPSATPEATTPEITSDQPYSKLEGFFIPRLRVPLITLTGALDATGTRFTPGLYVAASLSGIDRLGFHSWSFSGGYDALSGDNIQGFAYGNYALAPWYTTLQLSRSRVQGVTDLSATLSTRRSFWTTPLGIAVEALQRRTSVDIPAARLIGPSLSASYSAIETAPYGGPRRGLGLSFHGAIYPRAFGSSFDLADVAAELQTYLPLPFSRRHSFRLALRGRAVLGGPEPLLRVGGTGGQAMFGAVAGAPAPDTVLPPGILFYETVRGYEDHAVTASRVSIGSATYRYPFIIDRGASSFLWLFPSFFVRQMDLELFGQAAYVQGASQGWRRSAGAALALRTTWGDALPVSLFYQFAYRFDGALPPLHGIGLALE